MELTKVNVSIDYTNRNMRYQLYAHRRMRVG